MASEGQEEGNTTIDDQDIKQPETHFKPAHPTCRKNTC